jgi:hypothetical protein
MMEHTSATSRSGRGRRWGKAVLRRRVGLARRPLAVKHRPADAVPQPLIVEHDLADRLRELLALPPTLESACALPFPSGAAARAALIACYLTSKGLRVEAVAAPRPSEFAHGAAEKGGCNQARCSGRSRQRVTRRTQGWSRSLSDGADRLLVARRRRRAGTRRRTSTLDRRLVGVRPFPADSSCANE